MRTTWVDSIRAAATTVIATLLGFWSVLHVLGAGPAVVAVVLGMMLGRAQGGADLTQRCIGAVVLPAAAVAAAGVDMLMASCTALGASLFVLAAGGAIWVRRFGARATAASTLVTLPFVTALVVPAPADAGRWALTAVIVYGWSNAVQWLVEPAGFVSGAVSPAHPRPVRGILSSTRMAAQMAVALAAALTAGHLLFGAHWVWPVLTAFIVSSGHRGRLDVLTKGTLRLLGAAAGTVAATVLAAPFSPGDSRTIVIIFVLLGIATWMRPIGYAYWAAGVTAALALLYGYTGEAGADLLLIRLGGILLGGVLAIAACSLVLPVRTSDVLRRRLADVVSALTALLTAARAEPARLPEHRERFAQSARRFHQLASPLRVLPPARRQARLAGAVERCRAPVDTVTDTLSTCPDAARDPRVRLALSQLDDAVRDLAHLR